MTFNNNSENLISDFLDHKNILAVVGVSQNEEKYGHQVFLNLLNRGFKVYPIHPDGGRVKGYKRYKRLVDLPQKPDVVSIVVPPKIGLKIVEECNSLGIQKIWLQPGAESETILNYCQKHNLKVLSDVCIMKS